jgi:hypothetical protein
MEACERVLWNQLLPETESAIQELSAIIQKYEDDRAQKAREEEEEEARREAERERERLERLAATNKQVQAQSQTPSPYPIYFDKDGIIALPPQGRTVK